MTNESTTDITILIDASVLDELKSIMEEEYTDVLQIFLEESVSLMSEIHTAFAEETDNLTRAVHTLKSCSRNVGAKHLGNIAEKIEEHLINKDVTSAKSSLEELQDIFTQSHAWIKKHMQEHMHKAA